MKTDKEKCVFCKTPIPTVMDKNNPYPVVENGNCCAACNWTIVIPARLGIHFKEQNGSNV